MGGPVFNRSVEGVDNNPTPKGFGVRGVSNTEEGFGVIGLKDTTGRDEAERAGVYGDGGDSSGGVIGWSNVGFGVSGNSEGGPGVLGESDKSYGVRGDSNKSSGVFGKSETGYGVHGRSSGAPGVFGEGEKDPGVAGRSDNSYGVYGRGNGEVPSVFGESDDYPGVGGYSNTGPGLYGSSGSGLAALLDGNVTITGGVDISGPVNMTSDVNMSGPVSITGPLTKPGGSFKIDHPLDPANKYLSHSFVESPDMKNVYDGVVVLDDKREAEIELPDWFGALNKDFRYQLTAIGAPGPNLYIAEEISDDAATTSNYNNNKSRFKIAGGTSGMKVSWQVTGIRKDPWANAHRILVEEDKPAKEGGY